MRKAIIIFTIFNFISFFFSANAQSKLTNDNLRQQYFINNYRNISTSSSLNVNSYQPSPKLESNSVKNIISTSTNHSIKENSIVLNENKTRPYKYSEISQSTTPSKHTSFAIYNSDKSELINSKQVYANENLLNGEIQRFNNENELIESAIYTNGICKKLWKKYSDFEIHWDTVPFSENAQNILITENIKELYSAKFKSINSVKKLETATASNELGIITFQSIQKNYQPNFRSITNLEFTSYNNTTLRCWCKNENDEVYLQFPYASFYPSGHVQLRGNIYVNICKKNKVKPFGKWYKYDPFGNIIGTKNYQSLKEGFLTIAPPDCEEF